MKMRVEQLREILTALPADAEVILEGCDCEGDLAAVFRHGDETILLARDDGGAILGQGEYWAWVGGDPIDGDE